MTKQEAEARLLEVVRPIKLFKLGQIPSNYVVCEKQPIMKGLEDYRQCKPIYSQSELNEIALLKEVEEDG